ncbi:mevalonate kinase, partial [Streptococcus pyogenes]
LRAGALGAKMTGGGLGGCMIALADTKDMAEKISHRLKEEGAVNTWIQML